MKFTGLSAFPLTPLSGSGIDEAAFTRLVASLDTSGVDSIGALGSTGGPPLDRSQRAEGARVAVRASGNTPVMAGISTLYTHGVLELAEDAQTAGADAVLLAPMSYQRLSTDEVFGLYETVDRELSVPMCVYDNPGTTGFTFTHELHARIAALGPVRSVKIPGVQGTPDEIMAHLDGFRALLPETVTLGVSGDALAAGGLLGGADVWLLGHCRNVPPAGAGDRACRARRAGRRGTEAIATAPAALGSVRHPRKHAGDGVRR